MGGAMPLVQVRVRAPEMTRRQMRAFDGFTDAERNQMLYEYFWAASDTGGHLPPVRGLARVFFRRRNVQVFASDTGAASISILAIDPKLPVKGRRMRLWPGRNRAQP
jgi:hypothetical protein